MSIHILHTDGSVKDVEQEGEPSLVQLYNWLRCETIERVTVKYKHHASDLPVTADMIVDEEGKLCGKPINGQATSLYHLSHRTYDVIVGTAVLLTEGNRLT